jgi:hypothetical protein
VLCGSLRSVALGFKHLANGELAYHYGSTMASASLWLPLAFCKVRR